jgi:hypothetical protein
MGIEDPDHLPEALSGQTGGVEGATVHASQGKTQHLPPGRNQALEVFLEDANRWLGGLRIIRPTGFLPEGLRR